MHITTAIHGNTIGLIRSIAATRLPGPEQITSGIKFREENINQTGIGKHSSSKAQCGGTETASEKDISLRINRTSAAKGNFAFSSPFGPEQLSQAVKFTEKRR